MDFMPHCSLRFSLKTRWTTRSEQRTVFTDSLHLYVCGLASRHCTPALVQLAKASGRAGAQSWVQTRQALILTLLKTLCLRNTLTGPKVASSYDCSGNFRLPFPLSAHFDSATISFDIFPDTGAMPVRPGEPGTPTGQRGCGYKIHSGAAQHPAVTQGYWCSGICS